MLSNPTTQLHKSKHPLIKGNLNLISLSSLALRIVFIIGSFLFFHVQNGTYIYVEEIPSSNSCTFTLH